MGKIEDNKTTSQPEKGKNIKVLIASIMLLLRVILVVFEFVLELKNNPASSMYQLFSNLFNECRVAYDIIFPVLFIMENWIFIKSHRGSVKEAYGEISFLWIGLSILNIVFLCRDIILWIEKSTPTFITLIWESMIDRHGIYICIPLCLVASFAVLYKNKKSLITNLIGTPSNPQKCILVIDTLYFAGLYLDRVQTYFKEELPELIRFLGNLNDAMPDRAVVLWIGVTSFILIYYVVKLIQRYIIPIFKRGYKTPKDKKYSIRLLIVILSCFVLASAPQGGYDSIKQFFKNAKNFVKDSWIVSAIAQLTLKKSIVIVCSVFILLVMVVCFWKILNYIYKKSPSQVLDTIQKGIRDDFWNPIKKLITNGKDSNYKFANLLMLVYLSMLLVLIVLGVRCAYLVSVNAIVGENATKEWTALIAADIILKVIFAVFVAFSSIILAAIILLAVFRFVYSSFDSRRTSESSDVTWVCSFLISAVFSLTIVRLYFAQILFTLETEEEWINAILGFGSMVSVLILFMVICMAIHIMLESFVSLFQKSGAFSDQKNVFEKNMKVILSSLIGSGYYFALLVLNYFQDFFSNLHKTVFDTLTDDDLQEMNNAHQLIDKDVAKLLYAEYQEKVLFEKLEKLKIEEGGSSDAPPNDS